MGEQVTVEGFGKRKGSSGQEFSAVPNYEDLELSVITLLHQVDPTTKLGVLHAEQTTDELLIHHPLEKLLP